VLYLSDGVVGGVDHSRHLIEVEGSDRGEGLRGDVGGGGMVSQQKTVHSKTNE
jgi:hypothetical protein